MSITREFNLFLNAGAASPLVINVNQYDQGEVWEFTLYSEKGIQYTPSTGAIVGIKSDNLGIINTGTVVDGKVVINETEQMTAAPGRAVFELMIDSQTHGTANFYVQVEPKPGNNADLSESDLSLIQQAIDSTNPEAIAQGVSDWMDDNLAPSQWVIDSSLSVSGAAADAKAAGDLIRKATNIYDGAGSEADVHELERLEWASLDTAELSGLKVITRFGNSTPSKVFVDGNELMEYVIGDTGDLSGTITEEISDLKSAISGGGLTADIKQALMDIVNHIVFDDDDPTGQTYITNLYNALYPPAELTSITAIYTQNGTVYNTDSLDSLKSDLVVSAHYSDSTTETVSDYVLSGSLTVGTSTITVTYEGKTTTFTVTVTLDDSVTLTQSDMVVGTVQTVYKGQGYGDYISIGSGYLTRLAYPYFDIPTEAGATYEILTDWNHTYDLYGSAMIHNANIQTLVANHSNISNVDSTPWVQLSGANGVMSLTATNNSALRLSYKIASAGTVKFDVSTKTYINSIKIRKIN